MIKPKPLACAALRQPRCMARFLGFSWLSLRVRSHWGMSEKLQEGEVKGDTEEDDWGGLTIATERQQRLGSLRRV